MDPWVVLKKQYLDERSGVNKQNNAMMAANTFDLTNARHLNPFLNDNSTSQAFQNYNNNFKPPVPILRSTLNGSSWYIQSASRAVNQVIK